MGIYHEQKCPDCGSVYAEGGFVEIDGNEAWQKLTCECGCVYVEVYEYNETFLIHHGDTDKEDRQ